MRRAWVPFVFVFLGILACQDSGVESPLAPDARDVVPTIASEPAAMAGVVERISGSGHYVTPAVGLQPDKWRVFTMNARKMADGTVEGSFHRVVHSKGSAPEKASGTITCFTIVGNLAWIGGVLDGADGAEIAWQVMDNGEGKGAPTDEVGLQFDAASFPSLPAGFAQDFCEDTPEGLDFGDPYGYVPLFAIRTPVEAGNIQIWVK